MGCPVLGAAAPSSTPAPRGLGRLLAAGVIQAVQREASQPLAVPPGALQVYVTWGHLPRPSLVLLEK